MEMENPSKRAGSAAIRCRTVNVTDDNHSVENTFEARVSGDTTCEARVSRASETNDLEISSGEFHGATIVRRNHD